METRLISANAVENRGIFWDSGIHFIYHRPLVPLPVEAVWNFHANFQHQTTDHYSRLDSFSSPTLGSPGHRWYWFFFFLLTENVVTAPLWFIFLVLHKEGRSFHIWLLYGHDPHDLRCGFYPLIIPPSATCQGSNQFQISPRPIRSLALMKTNMMWLQVRLLPMAPRRLLP